MVRWHTAWLASFLLLQVSAPARAAPPAMDFAEARKFWAFQPVRQPALPTVADADWVQTPVDRFILAKLEEAELPPAAPATRRELIRRVYFDLLGLPPTPREVDAFVADARPDAYERLVDRLLSSPHYGERCGQHWLDVVRFAESEGFEYDRALPGAWRYRDYVVRAFNDDKPYDRFVTEQLAGDEIGPDRHETRIAAGFHRFGAVRRNAGNQEVASSRNEVLTERIDIVGSTFLGLSIGCARCHDHKYDPIPQKDYYRLQAFLAGTREHNLILAGADEQARWKERTEQINVQLKKLKGQLRKLEGADRKRMRARIRETEAQLPAPLPALCTITTDETPTAMHVLLRGEWDKKGEPVGMRPLSVLSPDATPELPTETDAPKTRLARWLTDPAHPLTARVMVNRIWQHHFGQGLLRTPNDFGFNGDRPSHPGLLDHLAAAFVAGKWRIKPVHRMILLSRTYRQSSRSEHAERGRRLDPANRLLWRFSRRRLEAEQIRDAMLAVSGRLNRKRGGPSVIVPVDQELIDLLYKPSQWAIAADPREHDRRSVYLIAKRNLQLPFMEVFDRPNLLTSCAQRSSSTHAPQALELLNGATSNALAEAFAERLTREVGADPSRQIERAYRLAVGRSPSTAERRLALAFLERQPLREFALALFNLNAFLYVN